MCCAKYLYRFKEEKLHKNCGIKKGFKWSEENKKKLSHLRKGRVISLETRKKISISNTGKKHPIGEKHWNWGKHNGRPKGVGVRDYSERRRFYFFVRKKVLTRDDYTCQICGIRGVDLQVDHIQSWKDCVDLRFDINNCRTLCAKCHYKITFGREMPKQTRGWGHNFLQIC